MTPLESYQRKLNNGEISEDALQRTIIESLDQIYHQLNQQQKRRDSIIGTLRKNIKPFKPVKGLYVWGKVGIGKTFLMDIFYECLEVKKIRLHFHAFMQQVHRYLREEQGSKNPLKKIAEHIANDILVICFDEFFVSNIADAMILGELFNHLFKCGVCLVTTSNVAPDDLYKNGIQRERFLPAIELIKTHVQVIEMASKVDYRRQHIESGGVYFTPNDPESEKHLETAFQHFSNSVNTSMDNIEILGREIEIVKQARNTIWLDFYKICGRPRSQNDYLELAKHYNTFLISKVPTFDELSNDLTISFINLIDVLYDQQKRLVIAAEKPVDDLYHGKTHKIAFDRTQSRLIEMQSKDYLSKLN